MKCIDSCRIVYDFILWSIHNRQIFGDRKYISGYQALGEKEEWRVTVSGYEVSFWGNKNVLELEKGYDAQFCEYTKTTEFCKYTIRWRILW